MALVKDLKKKLQQNEKSQQINQQPSHQWLEQRKRQLNEEATQRGKGNKTNSENNNTLETTPKRITKTVNDYVESACM